MMMMESLTGQLLVLGFIFIVTGLIAMRWPPKTINGLYGYRMPSSKKSQAHWDFAQRYYPKQMITFGLTSVFIAVLCIPTDLSETATLGILLIIVFIGIIWIVIPTERAIKQAFLEDD